MARQDFYTRLVYARQKWPFKKLAYYLLKLLGSEIPNSVPVGPGFILEHGGHGVVVHSKAKIGANVHIYQGVTLGRADIYLPQEQSAFEGIEIGDDVILSSDSKVLCREGVLTVGRGTVLGANAVLLESTGEYEIWAGSPARRVGERPRPAGEPV
jgi:serine O-acetyltransferase